MVEKNGVQTTKPIRFDELVDEHQHLFPEPLRLLTDENDDEE